MQGTIRARRLAVIRNSTVPLRAAMFVAACGGGGGVNGRRGLHGAPDIGARAYPDTDVRHPRLLPVHQTPTPTSSASTAEYQASGAVVLSQGRLRL